MQSITGPIPKRWIEYMGQMQGVLEEVPAVLYSTMDYVSGVTTKLVFFTTASGSREDLTNMPQANALPSPETFLAGNMRLYFKSQPQSDDSGAADAAAIASQFDDIVQLVNGAVVKLKIANKIYGPWPGWMLPANSFVKGAFASGSDLLADYGQLDGFLYPFDPYLMMSPLEQFQVSIEWPAGAITLSTGAETSIPIQVLLDGKMGRSVQ